MNATESMRRWSRLGDDARRLRLQTERALHALETLRAGEPLDAEPAAVEARLRLLLAGAPDLAARPLRLGSRPATLFFLEEMVDESRLERLLVALLEQGGPPAAAAGPSEVRQRLLGGSRLRPARTYGEAAQALADGQALLTAAGWREGLLLALEHVKRRSLEEPKAESVVRGPREGFIEDLETNLALVRARLRDPGLRVVELRLGRRTRTRVAVLYLVDLASVALVDEVLARLRRIDLDGVLESAYIEELIEDDPYSLFPQILHSERPDVVVAQLLEGRVAVLTDGTPFALMAPATLWSLLQANEDYYERFWIGVAIRVLRLVLVFLALVLPGLYVAVTTFHQEMIPTALLLRLAAAREGVPFPAMVEALIMEGTFEILREAGVRLPRQIGQALSIVGALVIGSAAVQADIVSAPMVVVVAMTGIASFALPHYNLAIALRILRFELIILGGALGLYGLMLGLLATLVHLSSLRSFGVPYLAPVAPLSLQGLRDALLLLPHWAAARRPADVEPHDPVRSGSGLKPRPPVPLAVTPGRRHEE